MSHRTLCQQPRQQDADNDTDDVSESDVDSDEKYQKPYSFFGLSHWQGVRTDTAGLAFWKWFAPVFVAGICTFASMIMLHWGTYYYIIAMERFENLYIVNETYAQSLKNDVHATLMSSGINKTDISYGALNDPLQAVLGWKDIDIKTLDKAAAAFPAAWGVLTLLSGDLRLWTKQMICVSCLALGKGIFGCLTVVPDSIGWAKCKERLQDDADMMKRDIPPPRNAFLSFDTWWALTKLEFKSVTGQNSVRWCADMLYSGHTYFTTLFALGLIESVRTTLRKRNVKDPWYSIIRAMVIVICLAQQIAEVVLVVWNRFHYTMDVFMAIFMTFLWFTNATIAIATKNWVENTIVRDPGVESDCITTSSCYVCPTMFYKDQVRRHRENETWAEFEVEEFEEYADNFKEIKDSGHNRETKHNLFKRLMKKMAGEQHFAFVPRVSLENAGELMVPICCFPFCCLFGDHKLIAHSDVVRQEEDTEANFDNDFTE